MSDMPKSYIESSLTKEDLVFEVPLRPQTLTDFVGQESVRERLEILLGAAKIRNESLGHCLLSGPPGLGKTTLAHILAKSMGTNLVVTSGPVIEKAGDLAGVLTNLKPGDVLFIDEIHRLSRVIEEYLYPAMEDFCLDIMIDAGASARSVQVKLNKFTLIGATTRVGLLSAPLRSRFSFTTRLDYYHPTILAKVIQRTARIINLKMDHEAAMEIARRSRGTPRIANNLARWVRDYSQIKANNVVNLAIVKQALEMLNIDEMGLDEVDIKILEVMTHHYNGGPVGLNTIALAVGEESHTIEEVHEPYLIMQGLIKRTSRGREMTDLGLAHLNKKTDGEIR